MKRILLILCVLSLFSLCASAQNNNPADWQKRMQSAKIAFLTNEMSLTPEEAQVFWPVYNMCQREHEQNIAATFKAFADLDIAIRNGKETADFLNKYVAAMDQERESKYLKEYLKVLPPEKVAKLYVGEERFRQSQIHSLRQPAFGQNAPAFNWGTKPNTSEKSK